MGVLVNIYDDSYSKFTTPYKLYKAVIDDDIETIKILCNKYPELKEISELLKIPNNIDGINAYFACNIVIAMECSIIYDRMEILEYLHSIIEISFSIFSVLRKVAIKYNRSHMVEWIDKKIEDYKIHNGIMHIIDFGGRLRL